MAKRSFRSRISPQSEPPDPDDVAARIAAIPHWLHRIEVAPGVTTPGVQDCEELLDRLGLPEDCRGMRALDVGARDGYFSFLLERRGAEVLAIDNVPASCTGFALAHDLLGSNVEFRTENVYDLSPVRHGRFDVVLFAGVLYHLRHPLLALDRIWDVCRPGAQLFIESHVIDEAVVDTRGDFRSLTSFGADLADLSLMQFFPGNTLAGDPTNQFGPNMTCLTNLLTASGFTVEDAWQHGSRGGARARAGVMETSGERAIDSAARWEPHAATPVVGTQLSPAP
jgi:tRNA (mo5U34)-methyltransferase